MKRICAMAGWMAVAVVVVSAAPAVPVFHKMTLTDKFYCEGAWFADFNKDGRMDVVAGPWWYEGPDFTNKHEIHTPQAFDPKGYSDNFLTFTGDFNKDGWADVLYMPYPGKEAFWYENPADKGGEWKKHLAYPSVDNESPSMGDLTGGGVPQMLFNTGGCLGFAQPDFAKPDEPWKFHPITPNCGFHKFTHGLGIGDINGDGLTDYLEANGWWEQPKDWKDGQVWIRHPFRFAEAAAQMYAYDVDGDGANDVICTLHCHKYGIAWYRQVKDAQGAISFEKHEILTPTPDLQSKDLRISQLHAVYLVDMNGDGLKDILTGKRYWSHGPTGDVEPSAPAVVYWFELRRDKDKGVPYIPHLIDDDSGVGTQVTATDLNGDGVPDVIVGNKKGCFLQLSGAAK